MPNIAPITFPIIGTANKLKVTVLSFDTEATSCNTYYELTDNSGKRVIDGNYNLTSEEFSSWGEDNSYIDTLVANHIGVTITQ